MGHQVDIQIDAPIGLEPCLVEVVMEGGATQRLTMAEGRAHGTLPSLPVRVRMLTDVPTGSAGGSSSVGDLRDVSVTPVDVDTLYEEGVEVPADGRLRLELRWGAPCLEADEGARNQRFSSWEHVMCAAKVGLDANGAPLDMNGNAAPIDAMRPLAVGASRLTFGQIIALAGDFYAHLDARAVEEFREVWPPLEGFVKLLAGRDYREITLAGDHPGGVRDLLDAVARDRKQPGAIAEAFSTAGAAIAGKFPLWRYAALASANFCHFNGPHAGAGPDEAETTLHYRRYHERAKRQAAEAGSDEEKLLQALVVDAFGCHFLTDAFAAGHMRVPRRLLSKLGLLRGSLHMSRRMHNEDNANGLWCRTRGTESPVVWRAYGDGKLLAPEGASHLEMVQEAVRRSVAEVIAASQRVAPSERVQDLLPVPLPPGTRPRATDQVLGTTDVHVANTYPLYWFSGDDAIMVRTGAANENAYRRFDATDGAAATLGFAS